MDKQALRQASLLRRDRLTPAQQERASRAVVDTLKGLLAARLPDKKPLAVALYAAIHSELDLAACHGFLTAWPARLYFPAVTRQGLRLALLPQGITAASFLRPGVFGVPEPPADSLLAEPPALDLVLVPGLAFDHRGGRLGWGMAHYDRFLPQLPPAVLRVGVAHSCQLVPAVPQDAHDQAMDLLLLPDRWLLCRH